MASTSRRCQPGSLRKKKTKPLYTLARPPLLPNCNSLCAASLDFHLWPGGGGGWAQAMMRHGLLHAIFKRSNVEALKSVPRPAWCKHLVAIQDLATWTRTCRGSPSLPWSRRDSACVAACPALAREAISRPMQPPACTSVPRWRYACTSPSSPKRVLSGKQRYLSIGRE